MPIHGGSTATKTLLSSNMLIVCQSLGLHILNLFSLPNRRELTSSVVAIAGVGLCRRVPLTSDVIHDFSLERVQRDRLLAAVLRLYIRFRLRHLQTNNRQVCLKVFTFKINFNI